MVSNLERPWTLGKWIKGKLQPVMEKNPDSIIVNEQKSGELRTVCIINYSNTDLQNSWAQTLQNGVQNACFVSVSVSYSIKSIAF